MFEKAGAIPYKIENGEISVLMITSIQKKKWIFPKGYIEPTQSAPETAKQEALEEAGVNGEIQSEIYFEYEESKFDQDFVIKMYLLKVKKIFSNWEEATLRERKWFPLSSAKQHVSSESLRNMMVKLEDYFTGL